MFGTRVMVSNGSERAQGEPSAVGAAPSVQIDRGPRLAPWLSPEPIRFLLALGSRKSTLPALRDDSEKAIAGTYGSKQLQQGQQHQRPWKLRTVNLVRFFMLSRSNPGHRRHAQHKAAQCWRSDAAVFPNRGSSPSGILRLNLTRLARRRSSPVSGSNGIKGADDAACA